MLTILVTVYVMAAITQGEVFLILMKTCCYSPSLTPITECIVRHLPLGPLSCKITGQLDTRICDEDFINSHHTIVVLGFQHLTKHNLT